MSVYILEYTKYIDFQTRASWTRALTGVAHDGGGLTSSHAICMFLSIDYQIRASWARH